ncbi:Triose-phosphate Transporter family [Musa troglodytarum]|uniref:Triose-phosphate Transporter family n=1 Tax=Musa troglodytarum TaxID=320322 RepID=A0A9E7HLW4_9LILI|nr:Triose-phosphate Transporter family [Musa troglodytarum]
MSRSRPSVLCDGQQNERWMRPGDIDERLRCEERGNRIFRNRSGPELIGYPLTRRLSDLDADSWSEVGPAAVDGRDGEILRFQIQRAIGGDRGASGPDCRHEEEKIPFALSSSVLKLGREKVCTLTMKVCTLTITFQHVCRRTSRIVLLYENLGMLFKASSFLLHNQMLASWLADSDNDIVSSSLWLTALELDFRREKEKAFEDCCNIFAYEAFSFPFVNITAAIMSDGAGTTKDDTRSSGNDLSATSANGLSWKDTLISLLQQASVYGVAAGYCISASLLSIINKWAVMKFPYPGALTALQYFTSAFGVLLCGWLKLVDHDRLELVTMWRFLPAAIIFYLSLFTNSELLLHANVDTFIVFRSAVPMFVAVGETVFLNQPWPSPKTWTSLATIFGGSIVYVLTDYQFTVTAYAWAVAYLVSMSIDFVYIKHVVMTIGLNTWGLVLYNNLEALMLFPLELLVMGELKKMKHDISDESNWYSFSVVLPVALSCLFGLAISFFGFSCRRAISATGFTVLGIVNKLLTVVINLVIWDKHSTLIGTIGLLICMFGGVMYQQSTSKPKKAETETKAQSRDEEQQHLLEMQATAVSDSTTQRVVSVDPK